MKTNYLFVALFLFSIQWMHAQPYHNFEVRQETYTPLTQPEILVFDNWLAEEIDEEDLKMPLPFDFYLFDQKIQELYFSGSSIMTRFVKDGRTYFSGVYATPELVDMASLDPTAAVQTQIGWQSEGTVGNRIFKIQVSNARSYYELETLESLDMAVSFQIWFHETSNAVSIHYGPNSITDFSVFSEQSVLVAGMLEASFEINEQDLPINVVQKTSLLTGNSSFPILKTDQMAYMLDYPKSGLVYQFTPITLSVENPESASVAFSIYPNPTTDVLHIVGDLNTSKTYTIFDLTGKKLQHGSLDHKTIDVSSIANGIYLLKLDNRSQTLKFIKK
ncbi:T9SS type A sorting domain-containing protein [Flavobacterium sp. JP2137]|uniref:T9SS type A sorting domain-containing protein n=1 Tax=Flavobacterium sp. JP2137 TaxID=3414510 RepID=UPI003D2FC399